MSQLYIRPFMIKGNTVNTSVGVSSAAVAVTRPAVGIQSIRIVNSGPNIIYINMVVALLLLLPLQVCLYYHIL